MVKVIKLEKKNTRIGECDHLLGKFLDHDSYDLLINEDTDVYKPLEVADEGVYSESNILLKFRKNVFSKKMQTATYDGLLTGATMTDNRGLAAGTDREEHQRMPDGIGSRLWVTKRQKAVLDYFASGSPTSLMGRDRLDEIIAENPNEPMAGRGSGGITQNQKLISIKGGSTWLTKTPKDFSFDAWVESLRSASPEKRKIEAINLFQMYISNTTYGNGVLSGVAGSMDRYPRIPFCRQTGWTQANPEKYAMALPLVEHASKIYKKCLPIRWEEQRKYSENIDRHFMIGDSVYTTITINRSYRTAAHRDAGDLCDQGMPGVTPRGFSNLSVVSNGKAFDGYYLCFPEFRAAVNIQPGDLIMMDAHQIHGNVPLISCEEGFERLSLVFYMREAMAECGSHAFEETRKNFVYGRRLNPQHPEWHDGWNGISPGCFASEEWALYLANNGFPEEAAKILDKGSNLESFF